MAWRRVESVEHLNVGDRIRAVEFDKDAETGHATRRPTDVLVVVRSVPGNVQAVSLVALEDHPDNPKTDDHDNKYDWEVWQRSR